MVLRPAAEVDGPPAQLIRHPVGGATRGWLVWDGQAWPTMELPWRGNRRNVSCVPPGRYGVRRHQSPRFGPCWLVGPVPGRSAILVHAGNTTRDTRGCVLPGTRTGQLGGLPAVLSSRAAMLRILRAPQPDCLVVTGPFA